MYPDCPSFRGRKHIKELIEYVKKGGKAFILFIAALPGVKAFKPNIEADLKIYEMLVRAYEIGVKVKSMAIYYNPKNYYVYLYNPDLEVEF